MTIEALRFNEGKPQLSYLLTTPQANAAIAKVFEYGAQKYAAHNWKSGMPYSKMADSLLRHLTAFMNGNDYDEESGQPHVAMVAWNALVLTEYFFTQVAHDDRHSEVTEQQLEFDFGSLNDLFDIDPNHIPDEEPPYLYTGASAGAK